MGVPQPEAVKQQTQKKTGVGALAARAVALSAARAVALSASGGATKVADTVDGELTPPDVPSATAVLGTPPGAPCATVGGAEAPTGAADATVDTTKEDSEG